MKKLLGKDVYVSVGGKVVALSSSCSISISKGLLEVAPRQSSQAREYLADRYTWQASFEALVPLSTAADIAIARALTAGTLFRIHIGRGEHPDNGGPFDGFEGAGYFTDFEEQAAVGSFTSYRATLTGSGPLVFYTESE